MENETQEFRKINDRCSELERWISANAPQCGLEEKHLIHGSQERAYWAHGYLTALRDVMRLFTRGMATSRFARGSSRKAA